MQIPPGCLPSGLRRWWWGNGSAVVTAVALLLSAGCVHQARPVGYVEPSGTCEGACEHYLACKGDDSSQSKSTCLAECGTIYVYEGVPDRDSLENFERLTCEAAVAFVDGSGPAGGSGQPQTAGERRTEAR